MEEFTWISRSARMKDIMQFTVFASEATIGQNILSLKYRSEHAQNIANHWISRRQKILYALLLIGCPWVHERSGDIIRLLGLRKWKEKIQRAIRWTETGLKIATLINFLLFLRQGAYLSILERILGIRSVFPRQQGMRQVTFEYMTRELLWHGFSEFLFFVLPLINFQRIKNFALQRLLPKADVQSDVTHNSQRDLTSCAVCGDWPIRAQEIGCPHVFCYFCIQSNVKADPGFACPLCRYTVGDVSNIQAVQITTRTDTDR